MLTMSAEDRQTGVNTSGSILPVSSLSSSQTTSTNWKSDLDRHEDIAMRELSATPTQVPQAVTKSKFSSDVQVQPTSSDAQTGTSTQSNHTSWTIRSAFTNPRRWSLPGLRGLRRKRSRDGDSPPGSVSDSTRYLSPGHVHRGIDSENAAEQGQAAGLWLGGSPDAIVRTDVWSGQSAPPLTASTDGGITEQGSHVRVRTDISATEDSRERGVAL
jgi:hypothetical protein